MNTTLESEKIEFRFTSIGDKGSIEKIIEFQKTPQGFWNLGFGDIIEHGDWEDNIITDNGDLRKVIQTVTNAIYLFLTIYLRFADFKIGKKHLNL